MREENLSLPENEAQNEYVPVIENVIPRDNPPIPEYNTIPEDANENPQPTTKRRLSRENRRSFAASLSSGVVAVVAVAVIGITNLLNVRMDAHFVDSEMMMEDGQIRYVVKAENVTEDDHMFVDLFEDNEFIDSYELFFHEHEHEKENRNPYYEGWIYLDLHDLEHRLQEDDNVRVKYRLDLVGDVGLSISRTYDSYTFQLDHFTSEIDNVDMWCTCGEDGYYNFKINYDDPLGKFGGFTAWIEDEAGNIATCEFTWNPHDAQRIFVNNLSGSRGRLYIQYWFEGEQYFIQFSNDENNPSAKDDFKLINL